MFLNYLKLYEFLLIYSIKLTTRRVEKRDYAFIENAIRKQFKTFFEPHEIEHLARECKFVQRSGLNIEKVSDLFIGAMNE